MNKEVEKLKEQILLKSLTPDELMKIYPLLKQKEFEVNDIILEEDESSTELYLMKEGEVAVLKWDQDRKFQLPLARLLPGQMFGEMSFMDDSPRSSTIKATKHTVVWQLSRDKLDSVLPEIIDIRNKLITNIAVINIQRLRNSNQNHVKNLRTEIGSLQRRTEKGQFAFSLTLLIGFIVMASLLIKTAWPILSLDMIYLGSWIILYPFVIILIKSAHYYLDEFGTHTMDLKKTIPSALAICIGGALFLFLCHWVYSHFMVSDMIIHPLGGLWITLYLIYCYANEFIVRGVLQTTLQRFFNDENGKWAVFLTTSFVTLFQLPLFYEYAFMSFIANLFLGTIYLYQQNILGVFMIHFILGISIKLLGF